MAMLAERRSKQKWSLNPRGKQWSDDSSKFGQKMLEKMGWTSGKGLGSNEQGPTEHVSVRVKNNRVGIGFEDKEDQWTQHQDDYGKLLQQLQGNNNLETSVKDESADSELSGKSLELKSKHSRARVHYHKFTRGKDVNKYSTKDLANIFGKKDLIEKNNFEKEQNEDSKEVSEPVGSTDNTGGFLTINGGNITDYFKKKLPDLFNKDSYHDNFEKTNSDSDTDQQCDFKLVGFKSESTQFDQESSRKQKKNSTNVFDNLGFDLNQPNSEPQAPKKRKNEFVFENEGLDLEYPEKLNTPKRMRSDLIIQSSSSSTENIKEVTCSNGGFINTALNLNSPTDESHNGIEFEVSRSQLGLDNDALDLADEMKKKKRVTFNDTVEYNVDGVKRKKSKAKLDKFEVENEKLKKRQKNSSETNIGACNKAIGFVNEALDVEMICEEVIDNELNERKSKKAKRKKSKKVLNLETIEEASEEDKDKGCEIIAEIEVITLTENLTGAENSLSINCGNVDPSQNDQELGLKVSKKKKKKDKKEKVEEKLVVADNVETAESEEQEPVKKKSKRKKEYREEIVVADETPKKKKKKERREVTVGDEVASEEKDSNFNKENTENRQDDIIDSEKKKKKGKVRRKSKGDGVNDASGLDVSSNEVISKVNNVDEEKEGETKEVVCILESMETSLTENKIEIRDQKSESRVRESFSSKSKSRRIIRTLFFRTPVLHFSGSNINDIKGYGVDIK